MKYWYACYLAKKADRLAERRDAVLGKGHYAYAEVLLNEICALRTRARRIKW